MNNISNHVEIFSLLSSLVSRLSSHNHITTNISLPKPIQNMTDKQTKKSNPIQPNRVQFTYPNLPFLLVFVYSKYVHVKWSKWSGVMKQIGNGKTRFNSYVCATNQLQNQIKACSYLYPSHPIPWSLLLPLSAQFSFPSIQLVSILASVISSFLLIH